MRVALLGEEELDGGVGLARRTWEESKKLWRIVAPAIFSRVVTYSMNVITQAFAGHLGDLELAAISIANTVVVGFNFGLMVTNPFISSSFRTPLPLFSIHLQNSFFFRLIFWWKLFCFLFFLRKTMVKFIGLTLSLSIILSYIIYAIHIFP